MTLSEHILEVVRLNPGVTPKDIASITGHKPGSVRAALSRLVASYQLRRHYGHYWPLVVPEVAAAPLANDLPRVPWLRQVSNLRWWLASFMLIEAGAYLLGRYGL